MDANLKLARLLRTKLDLAPSMKRAAIAAAAVCTVSCTVGPDYVRPPADVPAAYKEAPPGATAAGAAAIPEGRWWELFNDADLNALESQVVINNQTIRAAEARLRQAEAAIGVARAPAFPTLNFQATNDKVGFSAGKVGLTAGWELDLWGRIRRLVESSQAGAQATADDLAGATLSVQAQVAQSYFLLRVQDSDLRLLRDSVVRYERSLQLTRNQYAAGIVSRADVVQAEAQLNSTRAQVYEVELSRAQLEHGIAILIGKPPADFSIAATTTPLHVPALPPALPSELLVRRPDVAANERRMAQANAQIGASQAQFYPTLGLIGGMSFDLQFAGSITLAQYILDGGLREATREQATAAYDETVATYRQTVLSALADVEDNLAAVRILGDEAVVQDAAVKASRESVTITNNQYRGGTVNYLAVVVVQAGALANERAALAVQSRRLVASVNLIKALGGGWEVPPDRLATPKQGVLPGPNPFWP
jgi:NodT family efflux transporter outer membrane factor (OMF) lipoprotein